MNREELIDAIMVEMARVWGTDGFGGEPAAYEWLNSEYGITEEEDVQWQLIVEYDIEDLDDEDLHDDELMTFLEDDPAVVLFLERLLHKYRSGSASFVHRAL